VRVCVSACLRVYACVFVQASKHSEHPTNVRPYTSVIVIRCRSLMADCSPAMNTSSPQEQFAVYRSMWSNVNLRGLSRLRRCP